MDIFDTQAAHMEEAEKKRQAQTFIRTGDERCSCLHEFRAHTFGVTQEECWCHCPKFREAPPIEIETAGSLRERLNAALDRISTQAAEMMALQLERDELHREVQYLRSVNTPATGPIFGETFDEELDGARLRGHREAIKRTMLANRSWRTVTQIAKDAGIHSRSDVTRRIRDLRDPRNGGYDVERRRTSTPGMWEYRIRPDEA